MSESTTAEEVTETVYVSVDGFYYQAIYTPRKFGGVISHFEFRHWQGGAESRNPCPLTETGYRSHHFSPSIMDAFESTEAGAIAAIESQQDMKKFLADEKARHEAEIASRQGSLF